MPILLYFTQAAYLYNTYSNFTFMAASSYYDMPRLLPYIFAAA